MIKSLIHVTFPLFLLKFPAQKKRRILDSGTFWNILLERYQETLITCWWSSLMPDSFWMINQDGIEDQFMWFLFFLKIPGKLRGSKNWFIRFDLNIIQIVQLSLSSFFLIPAGDDVYVDDHPISCQLYTPFCMMRSIPMRMREGEGTFVTQKQKENWRERG